MGAVYKALDTTLQRVVAIKVVGTRIPDGQQTFTSEARTLARLHHPNIVAVYDVGETDAHFYFVTELVQGPSLADLLDHGTRLDQSDVIEIATQVGHALAFMHQHGFLHRDVKPSNILLSNDGRVLLSDFGLAESAGAKPATHGDVVIGTPRYMSPEQAKGQALDCRSDLYSLAVVVYEALGGVEWLRSRTSTEILRSVVETTHPSIRQFNPTVSELVDGILQKALSKDPNARYSAVDDFVAALRVAQRRPAALARLFESGIDEMQPPGARQSPPTPVAEMDATAAVPKYGDDAVHRLAEFNHLWTHLTQAARTDRDRFVDASAAVISGLLREAIGYRVEHAVPYLKGTVGYFVEAPFLWIRHARFPILVVAYSEPNPDILSVVVQQLEIAKAAEFFAILIVVPIGDAEAGTEAKDLGDLVANSVYRHDFIVLDRALLARVINDNSSRALVEIMLEQRADLLAALSPYVVSGPVPEQMFFGRESQLKLISQSLDRQDFAVIGGRRIGKSSTLFRLRRLLSHEPRYVAIYIDCEAHGDEATFLESLADVCDCSIGSSPPPFRRVLAHFRAGHASATPVFLLDEVDELLESDSRQNPRGALFKAFRAASHERLCRFVFSGSRTLFRHLHDAASPFFNFCESLELGRLEERSIAEIVTKPMTQLGFEMPEGARLIERIVDLTSSHPNLAQWICDRLIKTSISKRLTSDAVDRLAATPEFHEHYLATAWGDATPAEKLITLVINTSPFTDRDVQESLAAADVPQSLRMIRENLEILRLYALLDRDDFGYRFGLTQFPRIVRESGVATAQTQWLAQEVREQCS
jgi:hypothetical protein